MDTTMQKVLEQKSDKYSSRFGDILAETQEAYESTSHGAKRPWSMYDTVAVGKYMETWEEYIPVLEDDSTTRAQLGDVLKIGLGLVALQYATLPITAFASVQPLDDEAGVIYYRRILATSTRGAYTAGQEIFGATPGGQVDDAYYTEEVTYGPYTVLAGEATADTVTGTLQTPVRPRELRIDITGSVTQTGIDDGAGNLYGNGIQGTINYTSGAFSITSTGLTVGDKLTIVYQQNLAESDQIPGFKWDLTSKVVRASYFLVQSQFSTFAEFNVRRRFGRILSDDMASDAVAQINGSVLTSGIRKLRNTAITNGLAAITWSETVPAGSSVIEHRQTFVDALETASTNIGNATGRGAISFIIAGSKARIILRSLGFKSDAKSIPGPYLAGYFDGIPVFFTPNTIVLDDEVIVGYRGSLWFESPLVYSPFLPVTTVKGQIGTNLFQNGVATAHAAAIDTVVKEFVTRIRIVA